MPRHTHARSTRPTRPPEQHAEHIRELLAQGRADEAKHLHNRRVVRNATRKQMGRAELYAIEDLRAAKRELDAHDHDSAA